ncbi:MAG: ribosome-associated translation inhibitor RaiA [Bryobacteraceae bacterium]|nr:ribosome-associated translation inhibitor RaiA [Bryobacteraceae bacterium]MDW8379423.1 ribosome-associated translation inhibitor RaiA [Bryobacterales bacterium]
MKVIYTGSAQLSPAQQKKVDAKLAKLGKLLDRRGEKEVHVILNTERHLQRAEITTHYYDHPLVGMHNDSDAFVAISGAIEKLEKQILKLREKWRDTKRSPDAKAWKVVAAGEEAKSTAPVQKAKVKATAKAKATPPADGDRRVFRVNYSRRKPMTLEEAMIELDGDRDYLVYRDAESDRVNVLVKRRDGHFDLIEA